MIGVILWSDPKSEKAVIWCEDHGDLAFLSGDDCLALPDTFFEVGDTVEFDAVAERNLRKVSRASRLLQNADSPQPDSIRHISGERRALVDVTDSAQIIPFRLNSQTRPLRTGMSRQRRRG